jgi:hypothetical protein
MCHEHLGLRKGFPITDNELTNLKEGIHMKKKIYVH